MSNENDNKQYKDETKNPLVWKLVFILAPWLIVGLLAAAWVYM